MNELDRSPIPAALFSALAFWENLLLQHEFPLEQISLDGSFRAGLEVLVPERHLAAQQVSDIDILILAKADAPLTPDLLQLLGAIVDGRSESLRPVRRWDQEKLIGHVSTPPNGEFGHCGQWDFWLSNAPFVTVSPYWQRLFSSQEIEWQKSMRRLTRDYLDADHYQKLKVLMLTEARWRFCACFALKYLSDLAPREACVIEELPELGPMPVALSGQFKRWADGELNGMGLIRPLCVFPRDTRIALELLVEQDLTPPAAPLWTTLAEKIQLDFFACKKARPLAPPRTAL